MHDDSALREQLLEAQMRLELGEISRRQFGRIERDLLARIRALKREQSVITVSSKSKVTGVEIETWKSEG